MSLDDWITAQPLERHIVVSNLVLATGISETTIRNAAKGCKISHYSIAKNIQTATDGQVTIKELCE